MQVHTCRFILVDLYLSVYTCRFILAGHRQSYSKQPYSRQSYSIFTHSSQASSRNIHWDPSSDAENHLNRKLSSPSYRQRGLLLRSTRTVVPGSISFTSSNTLCSTHYYPAILLSCYPSILLFCCPAALRSINHLPPSYSATKLPSLLRYPATLPPYHPAIIESSQSSFPPPPFRPPSSSLHPETPR